MELSVEIMEMELAQRELTLTVPCLDEEEIQAEVDSLKRTIEFVKWAIFCINQYDEKQAKLRADGKL